MMTTVTNMKTLVPVATFAIVITTPSIAMAHVGHSAAGDGFVAGLLHPLLGWDHLLAMFSIGLLGAQLGGKFMWIVPSSFVLGMIGGGIAGMIGWAIPAVETIIAFSVLLLGACVALEMNFHPAVPVIMASIFGLFHGHAHGAEVPDVENAFVYTVGFTAATTLLHVLGAVIGRAARTSVRGMVQLRLSGAAIAMAGCWLLLGR